MPTPTSTPFVSGAVMVSADVRSALDDVVDYLNGGLIDGDVASGAIGLEHLVPPVFLAYPRDAMDAESQLIFHQHHDIPGEIGPANGYAFYPGAGTGYTKKADNTTAKASPRPMMWPGSCAPGDQLPAPGLGRRFKLDEQAIVCIEASFTVALSYLSSYLDRGGSFALRYRRVEDGIDSDTEVPATSRPLDTRYDNISSRHVPPAYILSASLDLDAGTYDVWVAYSRGTATSDVWQVTFLDGSLTVECFKGG